MPLARILCIVMEYIATVLDARTSRAGPDMFGDFYCDLQWDKPAPLETHLDEASAVPTCYEDRGPGMRVADQCRSPGPTNVG
jgi:hypothetical protein